jgi:hypothetical protein
MTAATPAADCAAVASAGHTESGDFWVTKSTAPLPKPTWTYSGRFHGSNNEDPVIAAKCVCDPNGYGGAARCENCYGNKMSNIAQVWDHNLETAGSASTYGWHVTKATSPAGITFDYGKAITEEVTIKYGVNCYYCSPFGGPRNLVISQDGGTKGKYQIVDTHLPNGAVGRGTGPLKGYEQEIHTVTAKDFQTLTFTLQGPRSGTGPNPNFRIYEIYPTANLANTASTSVVQKHCKLSSPTQASTTLVVLEHTDAYTVQSTPTTVLEGASVWGGLPVASDHQFVDLPSEVKRDTPVYYKGGSQWAPSRNPGNLPPTKCPHNGGSIFKLNEASMVSVCCSNHQGGKNVPTGLTNVKQLPHAWGLTKHGPARPCTFFQGTAPAGKTVLCCSAGWATGVFLPK